MQGDRHRTASERRNEAHTNHNMTSEQHRRGRTSSEGTAKRTKTSTACETQSLRWNVALQAGLNCRSTLKGTGRKRGYSPFQERGGQFP
jgi:hypothetical protein